MANKTMKTLTVGGKKYEIVDADARDDIKILQEEEINIDLTRNVKPDTCLKPQSPLQRKKDGNYFYPLTTVDQVIFDDDIRLDTKLENLVDNDTKLNTKFENLVEVDSALEEKTETNKESINQLSIDVKAIREDMEKISEIKDGGTGSNTAEGALINLGAQAKHTVANITLLASGWIDNMQTVVDVDNVTETITILVGSHPDNHIEYTECNVRCIGQGSGTLTFICESIPDVDIQANVIMFA